VKLSDIKGEQSLDVLADILEPIAVIVNDDNVKAAFKDSRIKGIACAIKRHKNEVVEIMARLDGAEPETYEYNLLTLPKKFLEIFNDEAVQSLF